MRKVALAAKARARREAWLWRNRLAFGKSTQSEQVRLFVDISAIIRHDAQTGIQRVVRAVWSELAGRSDGFDAVPVYATSTRGYCYAPRDFLTRGTHALPTVPVSVRPGDKFLGLDLSTHWLPKYRRQINAWRRYGATVHLVVYDLLPLTRPKWFTKTAASHFRKWYEVVARDADQAVCISDHVAHELRERLHGSTCGRPPSVGRLRMGADISASVPSAGICDDLRRLLEQSRFRPRILMVGTVEPRKGYDAALGAFEHIWQAYPNESLDLIIVGKPGWNTVDLQSRLRSHPELGHRLHWFDRMSDEGLCHLYEVCRGVLMTSRAEGFGLPLIEAAMHRRHVLARDLPVFREQRLPGMIFFNDDDPAALGRRILELSELGQKGPAPLANLPTWSDCVDGLLAELGLADVQKQIHPPLRQATPRAA